MISNNQHPDIRRLPEFDQHERVIKLHDPQNGLRGYIAIHNSRVGSAVGGTRMFPYKSEAEALADVLRLSRAMTFKCAISGVPHGGGKAVIIGDPDKDKTPLILKAFAQQLNKLGGTFITGEDVGINENDVQLMLSVSPYLLGKTHLAGDPSPYAALSTFMAIQTVIKKYLPNHKKISVAVKGIGKVGKELIKLLLESEMQVFASDLKPSVNDEIRRLYPQVTIVQPDKIHKLRVDIYAPCALGNEINAHNVNEIKAKIVCGSANNQLSSPEIGDMLYQRNITYIPDYIANAGGLINVVYELDNLYSRTKVLTEIKKMQKTLEKILLISDKQNQAPNLVADEITLQLIKLKTNNDLAVTTSNNGRIGQTTKMKHLINTKSSQFWEDLRKKKTLNLFQAASEQVPAYKDFLKRHSIDPSKITNWQDFQAVPPINKKNYLRQYSLSDMCWNGSLEKPLVYTATSGSTGDPVYFVRQHQLDWQYSVYLESFIENGLRNSNNGPVLVIVCFGMGLWIGGVITYKAFELAAQYNNYPLSIITPGFHKQEIIKALKNLSPQYNQTILAGYPPLIKDLIDEAASEGVDFTKINTRFLFAAEAITETFRDYLAQTAKIKNIFLDTTSVYGSADLGAMAMENTTSILVRRILKDKPAVFQGVFSLQDKTPTLAQYYPNFINFEAPDGKILITGNSAMPLVRYDIGDHGGVFSYQELQTKLQKYNLNLNSEASKYGLTARLAELPFVYVYERQDMATTLYGLWIYPEWIRNALLVNPISELLTGKFTMTTIYDNEQNQFLEINLEVKRNREVTEASEKNIREKIIQNLQKSSSEYREMHRGLGKKAWPKLIFWPYEDPKYFKVEIKQKWIQ